MSSTEARKRWRQNHREYYRDYMRRYRDGLRGAPSTLDRCPGCQGRKLVTRDLCSRCNARSLKAKPFTKGCVSCAAPMTEFRWHGKRYYRCSLCGLELKAPVLFLEEAA